ncbi:MAG: response regulator [Coleofasciculus sp. C2-GNP5-27]
MALILIVDDAAFTRRMIRKTLVADGHGTLEATNGQEGLDMAIAHQPDCILTDMLMPVMDGFQLLAALRDRQINTPVIVITADIQENVRQRCRELGGSGFINKPPKEAELRRVMGEILACPQETV